VTSEHFSDKELACHGKTCGPTKTGCHVNLVQQSLLDILEAFRAAVGKPVLVDDAYRCPIHNAEVGGMPHSEHLQGIAADIRVDGMTAAQLEAVTLKIPAIRGLGRDDVDQYVHVDTRQIPYRWCYKHDETTKQVSVVAYYAPKTIAV